MLTAVIKIVGTLCKESCYIKHELISTYLPTLYPLPNLCNVE